MARSIVLSNGYLAVSLDHDGFVRDVSYPHVGQENHVSGNKHRMGIWIDGMFSWLDDPAWKVTTRYGKETMVGEVSYRHQALDLEIDLEDVVYNELPVFIRHIKIKNPGKKYKEIRMFFGQEFAIGEVRLANTGFYDPTKNVVVHYKGKRVFLVNGQTDNGGIADYTIGVFRFEGKEGSWRDAEDGELSKNAVEHGPVDSVVRLCASCADAEEIEMYYWLCAAENLDDVYTLNEVVKQKTPQAMVHSTRSFWHAWAHIYDLNFCSLPPEMVDLYYSSLFVLRAHLDHDGGVIASLDSDMLLYGKDSYAYVWPRDAAYITMVLDKAGYSSVTKPFFTFCRDVLHDDGYLHHKFQADKSLGSTWQSSIKQNDWLKDKILQLPIQEDETATVIYALWQHFLQTRDIEFIELMYKPFIERAANFLVAFRDQKTGLPIHSYDLWEESVGVSTYTVASVIGGLRAAAEFSEILGKTNHMNYYRKAADELLQAMKQHLFDPELNSFVKFATNEEDGSVKRSPTIDASTLYGLWYYDILPPTDPMMVGTLAANENYLRLKEGIGGIVRYKDDQYQRDPGAPYANPWIITTLWDVQRRIKYAKDPTELDRIIQELKWVIDRMGGSPVLAEQFHPYTGEPRSVQPLAWSHAVYVETVLMYLAKLEKLGVGDHCVPRAGEK